MAEKRIVVPEGMLEEALDACKLSLEHSPSEEIKPTQIALEAALRWQAEEGFKLLSIHLLSELAAKSGLNETQVQSLVREALLRMFDAPEPEWPEEIADLRYGFKSNMEAEVTANRIAIDADILEAFRRGQRSAGK
jgi:hypothetical protein